MTNSLANLSKILAGGAVLALLCAPAYALDVGASVGGISASASIGGGGARAGVSAGNTSASASIGGGNGVSASVGGPAGTSASVGLGGGNGISANANIGGASVSIGTNPGGPATPGTPGTPGTPSTSNPGLSGVVAGMSNKELQRTRKRCAQVLGSGVQLDADLVALCKLVQMASR